MVFDSFMLWPHLGLLPNDTDLGEELISRMFALIERSNGENTDVGEADERKETIGKQMPQRVKAASTKKGQR